MCSVIFQVNKETVLVSIGKNDVIAMATMPLPMCN